MFLGIDRLLELVHDPSVKLIEHLGPRELYSPEGTGLDLRLGRLLRPMQRQGYLGVTDRQTPETEVVAEVTGEQGPVIQLRPREYFLATTIEWVNMPPTLIGLPIPRSTLFRCGIILLVGQIPPGYCGNLTFGITNASDMPVELEMGARIVHFLVARIDGTTIPYHGQWQGGRSERIQ